MSRSLTATPWRPSNLGWLGLCLLAGVVAHASFGAAAAEQDRPVADLLAAYEARQYDVALLPLDARLAAKPDVDRFERDLRRELPKWRPEVLAGFALDAAAIHLSHFYLHPARFLPALPASPARLMAAQLINVGRDALKTRPANDFDVVWHAAVVALLTGPPDERWAGSTISLFAHDALERHVEDLPKEIRNHSLVAMTWGLNREVLVQRWLSVEGVSNRVWADRPVPDSYRTVRDWLSTAATAYVLAGRDEGLKAEATLRLGLTSLYLGEVPRAFELWNTVASTSRDVRLRYLAHTFTGRALAAQGKMDEARRAYVAALDLKPKAPSARVPYAALLFQAGQLDDTAAVVDAILAEPAASDDPWWTYIDSRWLDHQRDMRGRIPR